MTEYTDTKTLFHIKLLTLIALTLFAACASLYAQENRITVGYKNAGQVDVKGFKLTKESTVKIDGYSGVFEKLGNDIVFYGWILDSKTKNVVWHVFWNAIGEYEVRESHGRQPFQGSITLPAGEYEAYYAAGIDDSRFTLGNFRVSFGTIRSLLDQLFGTGSPNGKDGYHKELSGKYMMNVSGPADTFTGTDGLAAVDEFSKRALISIVRSGENIYVKKSFQVSEDSKLNILALFEQTKKHQYDYSWIIDAATFEKVWPNSETDYKHAGGGKKNKSVYQTINLKKGTYTLYYSSDDSHFYNDWNVLPPNAPQYWGVSIWPDASDKKNIKITDNQPRFSLQLNRAHDNSYLTQSFCLKKDMDLRIICLGESDGHRSMADYGWIVDADGHKTIWEMTNRNSEYAGGAEKNRITNEVISLKKGNYTAYYVTDDSHSYMDWNDDAPAYPELWGLNIIAPDVTQSFALTDGNQQSNGKVLAEIVRVRDDENESRSFTLKAETKVRIYAIGESDGDRDMADYGWIKNSRTGKVVWEMTYRTTEHAGGAKKNRLFDGVILLPAGEYTAYYETDDSHSFRDWNDSPPYDQDRYGITVYKEE